MSALVATSRLWDLAPIGLDDLMERAALQTRVDRKYLVPLTEVDALLADLEAGTEILDIDGTRVFTYETVYFDTPELTSYLLTAYRRRRRFKVRTRTYVDSATCWLEVKVAGSRGDTVKHRAPYHREHHATVDPGREFVDSVLTGFGQQASFAPTLVTRYRRCTLFVPATASRVTIDTDLSWHDRHHRLHLPGLAVVETKTSRAVSTVDRRLWRRGHRPTRISKYATGLAALRTDLPDAPWRRVLRQHFTAAPVPLRKEPAPCFALPPLPWR